jgi:CspA family cold shock protein
MATGTVKWFNAQKGYGFIQPESGSKDVFVHISAVERAGLSTLKEGQKISFDTERPAQRQGIGDQSQGQLRSLRSLRQILAGWQPGGNFMRRAPSSPPAARRLKARWSASDWRSSTSETPTIPG